MSTTPVFGFPAPDNPNSPDGPAQMLALAQAIEDELLDLIPAGTVRWGVSAAPGPGWILCDGRSLVKADHPRLDAKLSAIGYPWGSTATEMTIPDMRGRVPVMVDGAGARLTANDAIGNSGGAEKHTLSADESGVRNHTHDDGTLGVASHTHSNGTLTVATHTHGDGTLAVAGHSHGDGTLGVANHTHSNGTLAVVSHSHSDGTLATDAHTHSDGTLSVDSHSHLIAPTGWPNEAGNIVQLYAGLSPGSRPAATHPHTHDMGFSGTSAPGVSGATGSAGAGVSGNTGSAAPNVSGDTAGAAPDVTGSTAVATADVTGATGADAPDVTGVTSAAAPDVTGATGNPSASTAGGSAAGAAHNNMPPYTILYAYIKT